MEHEARQEMLAQAGEVSRAGQDGDGIGMAQGCFLDELSQAVFAAITLNGVFTLVLASLMSAAFAAFQVSFDVQLGVLILIGVGIAVTGYVMFEIALGWPQPKTARRNGSSRAGSARAEQAAAVLTQPRCRVASISSAGVRSSVLLMRLDADRVRRLKTSCRYNSITRGVT